MRQHTEREVAGSGRHRGDVLGSRPRRDAESDLEFEHWLNVLARRAPLFVAVLLAVLLLGEVAAVLRSPSYETSAEVVVGQPVGSATVDPSAATQPDLPSELKLAQSAGVAAAAARVGNSGDATVRITQGDTGGVLTFTADGSDPTQAATAANAYAAAFVSIRSRQVRSQYDALIGGLRAEVAKVDRQLKALTSASAPGSRQSLLSQRQAFQDTLDRATVASVVGGPITAQILTRASVPDGPTNPSLFPYMSYVLLAGLFVAAGAVGVREFRDESVTGPKSAERLTGSPVLGTVGRPRRRLRARDRHRPRGIFSGAAGQTGSVVLDSPRSPEAESFRSLRATVTSLMDDHTSWVLQVTNAAGDDGAATVAVNLAVTLAQGHGDTLLLNFDERAALLSTERSDNPWSRGGMLDERSISESVWTVPGVDALRVLQGPLDSSDMLTHPGVTSTFEKLRSNYSCVIVLAPPVLRSSAALHLTSLVDATVVCVSPWSTQVPDLVKADDALSLVEGRPLGVVIT